MALSQSSSKDKVAAAFAAYFGASDDPAQAEKAHNAIAKAINDILLDDAVVEPTEMLDSIGSPVTGTGTIT